MKKKLLLLLILLFPFFIKAEVTDTTPPTLNSYSFGSTTITSGKTVKITIKNA